MYENNNQTDNSVNSVIFPLTLIPLHTEVKDGNLVILPKNDIETEKTNMYSVIIKNNSNESIYINQSNITKYIKSITNNRFLTNGFGFDNLVTEINTVASSNTKVNIFKIINGHINNNDNKSSIIKNIFDNIKKKLSMSNTNDIFNKIYSSILYENKNKLDYIFSLKIFRNNKLIFIHEFILSITKSTIDSIDNVVNYDDINCIRKYLSLHPNIWNKKNNMKITHKYIKNVTNINNNDNIIIEKIMSYIYCVIQMTIGILVYKKKENCVENENDINKKTTLLHSNQINIYGEYYTKQYVILNNNLVNNIRTNNSSNNVQNSNNSSINKTLLDIINFTILSENQNLDNSDNLDNINNSSSFNKFKRKNIDDNDKIEFNKKTRI
jgi:hypothetical protein